MKPLFPIVLLTAVCLTSFSVRAGEPDCVTAKDGTTYSVKDDKQAAVTDQIEFPNKILVNTNGTFTVAGGKERKISSGQLLRRDGWLVNTDGSIQLVIDHVEMREGKVSVVRDGQTTPLTQPMTFPNGMRVNPDGMGSGLPGGRIRLADGELFRLDGVAVPSKDTVTLKQGRVVVQRSGSLIQLKPGEIMGMCDATRVDGDGNVQPRGGPSWKLREGKTILFDGAIYSH